MSNRSSKRALDLKNVAAYEEAINHISKTAHVFRFMTIGVDGPFGSHARQELSWRASACFICRIIS